MFAELAEALHVAHQAGVVHRDVKPSNLLLDQDGLLHITDFGVARLMDGGHGMTQTGDIVGTPAYMSPEQARARSGELDQRTDIYSLGATLYEVVTLEAPFEADDIVELYRQIVTKEPRAPSSIDRTIPHDLETIIQKAMQKAPDDRYRTARMMARDLRAFADDRPIAAQRTPAWQRAWKTMKRNPGVSAATGAALVAVLVAGLFWWQASSEGERRTELEYDQLLLRIEESFQGRGRGDDPATLIDRAIAAAPDRHEAYNYRSMLQDRSAEARLADVDRAVERGLSPLRAHQGRGVIYQDAKQYDAMRREYAAALALPGGDLSIGAALTAHQRGSAKEVERILGRIIDDTSPWSLIGREARQVRMRTREARRDFEGALLDAAELRTVSSPDDALADRMSVARLWHRLGKTAEAEQAFREILADAASAPSEVWESLLGEVPGYAGFRERLLDAAESQHRDEGWYLIGRAVLLPGKDPASALGFAKLAVAKRPDDVRAHLVHGRALLLTGDVGGAKRALERARELGPGTVLVIQTLAQIALEEGRYEDALELAEEALATGFQLQPAIALRMKAQALAGLDDIDGALDVLEVADRARQRDPQTLILRARLLLYAQRADEALAVLRKNLRGRRGRRGHPAGSRGAHASQQRARRPRQDRRGAEGDGARRRTRRRLELRARRRLCGDAQQRGSIRGRTAGVEGPPRAPARCVRGVVHGRIRADAPGTTEGRLALPRTRGAVAGPAAPHAGAPGEAPPDRP